MNTIRKIIEDRSIDVGEGERLNFWKARKTLTEEGCRELDRGDAATRAPHPWGQDDI